MTRDTIGITPGGKGDWVTYCVECSAVEQDWVPRCALWTDEPPRTLVPAAALADRDAQVTRVRALADEWEARFGGMQWTRDLRRALDGAGDEPRPFSPDAVAERLAGNQDPQRQGLVPVEPTGDEPPTEPPTEREVQLVTGCTCWFAQGWPYRVRASVGCPVHDPGRPL